MFNCAFISFCSHTVNGCVLPAMSNNKRRYNTIGASKKYGKKIRPNKNVLRQRVENVSNKIHNLFSTHLSTPGCILLDRVRYFPVEIQFFKILILWYLIVSFAVIVFSHCTCLLDMSRQFNMKALAIQCRGYVFESFTHNRSATLIDAWPLDSCS